MALLQIFKSSPAPRTADRKMKFKIHRGTADRVAANLTLSEWPGIVKLLRYLHLFDKFLYKFNEIYGLQLL